MPITARSKHGLFKQVMAEWKKGTSKHIKSKKQAVAVAMSYARKRHAK
jgi:hypothetical protein